MLAILLYFLGVILIWNTLSVIYVGESFLKPLLLSLLWPFVSLFLAGFWLVVWVCDFVSWVKQQGVVK